MKTNYSGYDYPDGSTVNTLMSPARKASRSEEKARHLAAVKQSRLELLRVCHRADLARRMAERIVEIQESKALDAVLLEVA